MMKTCALGILGWMLVTGHAAAASADPMAPPPRLAKGVAPGDTKAVPVFVPANLLWTRVGSDTALAWYGGRLVQAGMVIDGARIESIAEDHLVVSHAGRRHRVLLLKIADSE